MAKGRYEKIFSNFISLIDNRNLETEWQYYLSDLIDEKQQIKELQEALIIPDIDYAQIDCKIHRRIIERVMSNLKPVVINVIKLRFGFHGKEYSYEEIGKLLHKTPLKIKEYETKGLIKLRHYFFTGKFKKYSRILH